MGPKHSKELILAGAVEVAFRGGLSQLTFGRVAEHLGIHDRTVVYYFPSKDDLVAEVVTAVGARLQEALAPAFRTPAADGVSLARAAWPVLAQPASDPVFALFFEATGLASAGRQPYETLVPHLVEGWIAWVEALIEGPPAQRRAEAAAAIALVDGLLLLRQLAGSEAADQAAGRLGLR